MLARLMLDGRPWRWYNLFGGTTDTQTWSYVQAHVKCLDVSILQVLVSGMQDVTQWVGYVNDRGNIARSVQFEQLVLCSL
jgi:hypothetical protein